MKKLISYVLLLAMCLALFAGCAPEAGTNSGLDSAKTYLYNMYKDTAKTTKASYDVVGMVVIQGVGTYNVEWTVNSDAITVTPNGKMVTIGIPEYPEAEINYTLTATIKDDKGNTATVAFEHNVPKAAGQPATLANGTYIIANGNLTMSSLAEEKGYGYPTANEVTIADGQVSNHFKADVLTITNVEGGVTIQDAYGRYFYLKGSYNSFNVDAAAPAEGHIWTVLKSGDSYLIVNAMNKNTLAYSTSYKSWGCYPELTEEHQTALTIIAATAPAADPVKPDEGGNDPAADSTLTVEQVIALGASKAHNTYTAGKYYVTGVITEVYNETYGNMKITDSKGNILTIYGTYDATGANRYDAMATKPVVGDTVTIYGIVGQYNDTPQVKNGWITAHTPATSTPVDPDNGNSDNTDTNTNTNTGDVTLANGMKVVIYAPGHGKALSSKPSSEGSFYQMGVDVTVSGSALTGYSDTEVWTVVVNSDGSVSFEQGGKKLGMQDSYSSMSLGAINDKWEVISLGNGLYNIKNTVRGNMIEWYASKNNWSTYTSEKAATDPLFQMSFFVVE